MSAPNKESKAVTSVVKENTLPLGDTCVACGAQTNNPCGVEAQPGCAQMGGPACDREGFVDPEP